jgi:hypothetical protein
MGGLVRTQYVHTYIHTIHTYVYACVRAYIHTNTHTHTLIIYIYTHTHTHTHLIQVRDGWAWQVDDGG